MRRARYLIIVSCIAAAVVLTAVVLLAIHRGTVVEGAEEHEHEEWMHDHGGDEHGEGMHGQGEHGEQMSVQPGQQKDERAPRPAPESLDREAVEPAPSGAEVPRHEDHDHEHQPGHGEH
jgi:hypothetical protein